MVFRLSKCKMTIEQLSLINGQMETKLNKLESSIHGSKDSRDGQPNLFDEVRDKVSEL